MRVGVEPFTLEGGLGLHAEEHVCQLAPGLSADLVLPQFCEVGIRESVVRDARKEGPPCRVVIRPSADRVLLGWDQPS